MDPEHEACNMVDTISTHPLPTLPEILSPYDPDIKNIPPRPPNTYLLFRVWMSKLGDRQTVISHLIWREVKERRETKETIVPHFEGLAREAKEVHRRAYPEYKYRPGKRGAEECPEAPRQRGPKKKKHRKNDDDDDVGLDVGLGSAAASTAGLAGAKHRVVDAPTATRTIRPGRDQHGRDFELRQAEALIARTQAYEALNSSSSSAGTASRSRSDGRTFPSRYLPEPIPSPGAYHSTSSTSTTGIPRSYPHSHPYSHSHSHSHSYSSSYSSNTHLSPSSSSSSSSSPSHSPLRSPSSSSSSSEDSDFEFNFRYERNRSGAERAPWQGHNTTHRHPMDVDAPQARVPVDGSNRRDVTTNHANQREQRNLSGNGNVRRIPGRDSTEATVHPRVQADAEPRRYQCSDYDSDSGVEEL